MPQQMAEIQKIDFVSAEMPARGLAVRVNLLLLHMASLGFSSQALSRECQG